MAEANVLNTFQCGFESHRGHMNITNILSREHSASRFEIYQTDYNLRLRCHVCGLWLSNTEVTNGLIEIEGCRCSERRVKIDDMFKGAGITVLKYDSTSGYHDEHIQFIKDITATEFPLDDLLNGRHVEDMVTLYQWIAFWTGNDVSGLELDFSVPR